MQTSRFPTMKFSIPVVSTKGLEECPTEPTQSFGRAHQLQCPAALHIRLQTSTNCLAAGQGRRRNQRRLDVTRATLDVQL